jgi:flagellar assembly factor FliW
VNAAGVPVAQSPGVTTVSDTVAAPPSGCEAAQEGVAVRHDVPELEFVRPLLGFPGLSRYVLVRLGDHSDDDRAGDGGSAELEEDREAVTDPDEAVLYELRCVEQPDVRFLVAVPTAFFDDYTFELDEPACAELGLSDAEEALVLVVLTIGDNSASTTANLLAPVIINARTRSAAQVILSGTDWPVRAAVV